MIIISVLVGFTYPISPYGDVLNLPIALNRDKQTERRTRIIFAGWTRSRIEVDVFGARWEVPRSALGT